MGLKNYLEKRDFKQTPEPKGQPKKSKPKKLAFVVQEHHASHLHYDFRLELDGVLKSWAVPKGPSLNPHDHHLAIQTEDHPYEYRKFEGVIPEGNYGAGNVIIWDEGWYEARKGDLTESEKTLRTELKKGHLTFILHGTKLKGEFALIKMPHAKEDNAWLLIKKGDEFASTRNVTGLDRSAKSHMRVDDLGARANLPNLKSYPKKAWPWRVRPMLSTLIDEPFSKEGWLFEIKWDGYRAIGTKKKDHIELYSRADNDFVESYPPVVEALRAFEHDVIVDGEIVVVDEHGTAHFEWLQNWKKAPHGTLHYYLFDILWCDTYDIRTMPLRERKKLLKSSMPRSDILGFSDDFETDGLKLFKEMQSRDMEGMVAKRGDSPYRENDRGQDWLKIKTHLRQEVVIGGFTEPRGSRKHFGSLVVGVYDKDELVYVGHSGGGIADEQRKTLRSKLDKIERKTSPFTTPPKPNAPVHWVKPVLVCEMSFSEWTEEGYMRQPQFEGLREDKKPASIRREKPKKASPANQQTDQLQFTHEDKIFFPKYNYTKGDIRDYYERIAPYILPYLKDRPLSLLRQPNGITGEAFFQKNMEHLPDWVPSIDIFSESNNAKLHWVVGGKLKTLLYLVQLGSIEINPWNSRIQHLDRPDWAVIDLDPEGVTFKAVITVAKEVKQVCDEWQIPCYPKTSGKTGIHIYIPMQAHYTYEQVKNFAHLLALEINKRQPKLTSVERMPAKRRHKIYLDFLQNREGQTLAAPYSLRPTPDATVSTPLHWDEVNGRLTPKRFTIKTIHKRLEDIGDLWKPVMQRGLNLRDVLKNLNP